MTSRRRVEAAVAIAMGSALRRAAASCGGRQRCRSRFPEEAAAGTGRRLPRRTVPRSLEGTGLRGPVLPALRRTAPRGMTPRGTLLLSALREDALEDSVLRDHPPCSPSVSRVLADSALGIMRVCEVWCTCLRRKKGPGVLPEG